ncbi:M23 family metallopeptidase [Hyphococcus formosus]|uniref:M23 family metallopeptidase n=1 Tax=Hyphococcus formosus TaxID=3143534 RepID=UPI00398A7889
MLRNRVMMAFAAAASLSACATTSNYSGPTGGIAPKLALCSGTSISNAPPIDGRRNIIGYDPVTDIRGVLIYRAPVSSCVSSGFGPRRGGAGSFHHGVDLYTRAPSAVYAGADGRVESVGSLRGYGKTIVITHASGIKTRYAHLSEYVRGLRRGDRVKRGAVIGRTGNTGNATAVHLHYEIIIDGKTHNPLIVGR